MLVTTAAFNAKVLAAMIESVTGGNFAGPLVGCKMALFTNSIPLTSNTVWADLVEATFTGYAQVALTYDTELSSTGGQQELLSNLANFRATAAGSSETIIGYAITDGGGTPVLLGAEALPSPVPVPLVGSGCSIVSIIGYAGDDIGGGMIIS